MRSFVSSPARSRWLVIGAPIALAAAGAATAAWMHVHASNGASHGNEGASAAAQDQVFAVPVIDAGRNAPGRVIERKLSLESALTILRKEGAQPFGGTITRGTLVETTLQVTNGAVVSLLSIEGAEVTLQGARQPETEAALATGIVVERDARGVTTRARLPKSGAMNANLTMRLVADLLQWTPGDQAWSAHEATSRGRMYVQYTRDDAQHVRKHTVRVESGPAGQAPLDLSSDLQATLDGDVLADLHGEVVITTNAKVSSRSSTRVSMERGRVGTNLARAMALSASLEDIFDAWSALDAPPPHRPFDETAMFTRQVNGRSLADIEALLGGKDEAARQSAATALRAYLRLHPDACEDVGKSAASSDPMEPAARSRVMALLNAGSPEAQRALVAVAKAWRTSSDPTALVAGLGTLTSPTPETVESLRSFRDDKDSPPDVARTSGVALGNIADKLRDTDPARADALAAEMEDRMKQQTDPGDIATSLVALGNARSERAREAAAPYLESTDPQVRRMAVFAYGRSGDDEARAKLKHIAETDPDENVRREAALFLGT